MRAPREGGPAQAGPSQADLRAAPGAQPGGTAARTRRGGDLPHRVAQQPFSSTAEHPVSYYGQPVIKTPVWSPEIAVYFFTGGLAGASAPLAFLAEVSGQRALAQRAWAAALAGVAVSPVLLIHDLGQPKRFLHMLRVFKVTSPMSVGTWVLSATGTATGFAAARSLLGWFPRAGAIGSPAAAALGPVLATYTAVLVTDTAVPAWHEARRTLPAVFAASAAASAGAATTLLAPARDAAPARRLAVAGSLVEVAAATLMERRLGDLGEPYHQGTPHKLSLAAKLLGAGGAAAVAAGGRRRAWLARPGAASVLAGALCERLAVFRAGIASAEDPKYTVAPQRARLDAQGGRRTRLAR
jgi:hypothetical protein